MNDANWTPTSWKQHEISQPVDYQNQAQLNKATSKLSILPPLVLSQKVVDLKILLTKCQSNECFLLQGGDCAELFDYCTSTKINDKIKVLLQMSLILVTNANIPVVRIGRIAGQYAKPRTKLTEMVDGKECLAFRGDIINSNLKHKREYDPDRMLEAYFHSASTLNYLNLVSGSGFADLRNTKQWNIGEINDKEIKAEYESTVNQLSKTIDMMDLIGITDPNKCPNSIKKVDIYTSHEAMLLEYEAALTRKCEHDLNKWYSSSAHFLWVGDRTRQLNGAHIEYLSGIINPIGIKVGPTSDPGELVEIIKKLNKVNEKGKIVIITRFGSELVEEKLPPIIKAVKLNKLNVCWISDPMHGNTESVVTKNGQKIKTRRFSNIYKELKLCFMVHKNNNSRLNGVHFELTGDNITECLGGFSDLDDLETNYETLCDPRLNYEQSLSIAFLISKLLKEDKGELHTKQSDNL